MPVRIQLRRGTASQWTSANPVLASGEIGLETDTLKIKIGNGTTAWNSLQYFTQAEGVAIGGTTGQVLAKASATNYDTHWVNPSTGDMTKAVYDPSNVSKDAFNVDNHTDGTTNKVYTATEKTKLAGIESGADVTDASNVGSAINGATEKTTPVDADTVGLIDSGASNILKKLSWSSIKTALKTYFDTLYSTFSGAYADLTGKPTIPDSLDDLTGTLDNITAGTTNKHFTDTEKTKLSGIEDGADVTDADNVSSAGALMDSEVDADIKTLTLPANTTISTFGASLIDDTDASTARTTLGVVKITVSSTKPSSPSTNDLWVDIS